MGHDHTLRVVVLDGGLKMSYMALTWRVMVVMRVMTTPYSLISMGDYDISQLPIN